MSAVQLLTEHLSLWSSADTEKKSGRGRASGNAASVYGIKKLRELILELAARGKLVPQVASDEPASELFQRIVAEKNKLIAEGKIKKSRPLAEITDHEKPFDLPQGWEWVRLGEVMLKITDGTHHSPPNILDGEFKYISAKNIKPWGLDLSDVTYVTKIVHDEIYSRCDPEYGDVLYIKDGATTGIATINTLDEPFSMLSSVALLKPSIGVSNLFLLKTITAPFFYAEMRAEMTGVAITRVTLAKLNNAMLPIPPLAEQHRIVAKVDELMTLCDQLENQHTIATDAHEKLVSYLLNTLTQSKDAADFNESWQRIAANFEMLFSSESSIDALKQTLLQLAVMGKLVPQDASDEPACELLKRIQAEMARLIQGEGLKTQANLSIDESEKYLLLPPNWDFYRLGNLAKFIDYRGRTPEKIESGIPLITAKNVRFGFISRDPYEYISEAEYNEWMTRGFPRINDLLFTTEAPLGNVAIINIVEKFALAQRVICLQLHLPEMAQFLRVLMMSKTFQELLNEQATGMTATGIKASKLKELPIVIPPLAEQHRIVAKVDELMTLCDALKSRISAANQLQQKIADVMVEQAVA